MREVIDGVARAVGWRRALRKRLAAAESRRVGSSDRTPIRWLSSMALGRHSEVASLRWQSEACRGRLSEACRQSVVLVRHSEAHGWHAAGTRRQSSRALAPGDSRAPLRDARA